MDTLLPPWPGTSVSISRAHRTENGEWRWRVNYQGISKDGTKRKVRSVVGPKAQAELACARLKMESHEAKALGKRPVPRLTMIDLRDRHLERTRDHAAAPLNRQVWALICDWFGKDRSVLTITPADVSAFRTWALSLPQRRRPGDAELMTLARRTKTDPWGDRPRRQAPTINRYLHVLQGGFSMLIEDELMTRNPVRRGHYMKEKSRKRVPEGDELSRMLAAADPELRVFAIVAAETSLRQSSVLKLERSRVDLVKGAIFVPDTKTGMSVVVPLSRFAIETLTEWMANLARDRLFRSKRTALAARWCLLGPRIGITGLRFHDLRRHAATRMLKAGIPFDVVMRIGGWKRPETLLKIYSVVDDSRILAAREALDALPR